MQHAKKIHSLTSISAEGWCSHSCYGCITTVQEMQQVPELIWMWWLKNKSTSMPGTEAQVAHCHIHITELFQHSDYMQKCSNLYTANAVLLHCSLPGLIKRCILISNKKLPLTLFSLQDKTNNSLFGEEGKTITHHWSNSITTWSKEYACHNDKMTVNTESIFINNEWINVIGLL